MRWTGINWAQIVLVTILAGTACTTNENSITAARPRPGSPVSFDLTNENPVVASVTGHWEVISLNGLFLNKISVSALKRLDGTVTGEAQYEQFDDEGKTILAHGDVKCLEVEGNVARIGAVGENKLATPAITAYGMMTVIDNGEGSNDPPDRGSSVFSTLNPLRMQQHCGTAIAANPPVGGVIPDRNVLTVQRGNIQVRSFAP